MFKGARPKDAAFCTQGKAPKSVSLRGMIAFGICLAVLAAGIGTTSKQLIAYSEHVKQKWIFHVGAGMNIFLGPVVDASAYAYAPQVVIAPFACLDVIFNALSAPYTLSWQEEKLAGAHVFGTTLVAIGAVSTSLFGAVSDRTLSVFELEDQLTQPAALVYYFVEIVAFTVINLLLRAKLLSPQVRGISLGVIAGVLMGNVFCIKGFIGIVKTSFASGDSGPWLRPTPYLLLAVAAGGAILGHIFMKKGLGEYKGVFMVTIFEGAHISAACLSGCVVMQEMAHAPWWRYLFYWISVGTIVSGMLLINTSALDSKIKGGGQRQFHIAQSFANSAAGQTPIGRWDETHPQPDNETGYVSLQLLETKRAPSFVMHSCEREPAQLKYNDKILKTNSTNSPSHVAEATGRFAAQRELPEVGQGDDGGGPRFDPLELA